VAETPHDSRQGSQARRQGRGQRDKRNFIDPQEIREALQALLDDRIRSDQRIEEISASIKELTKLVAHQSELLSSLVALHQTLPSVEPKQTRTPPVEHEALVTRTSTPLPSPTRINYEPSPTPVYYVPVSALTEQIQPLGDGTNPTFRQWKISIRDRLVVNSDYYQTELARKALIWATTTDPARTFLLPRYDSEDNEFATADEMIDTLDSCFTTGFETLDHRERCYDMKMGDKGHANETFRDFLHRFRTSALLGKLPANVWFHMLWDRITPQLQNASAGLKPLWKEDFESMVRSLTSIDRVRRRSYRLDRGKSARQLEPMGYEGED
jgi:hypothetical protein